MNTTTKIIERFLNSDDGIEVIVAEIKAGFSVVIRDVDADMYVPTVRIFPSRDRALEVAAAAAMGKASGDNGVDNALRSVLV